MTLVLDDTGSQPKLIITSGKKTLLKKKGKSIKQLLRFVYSTTSKQNIKEAILEMQSTYQFMIGSRTKMEIL